MTVVIAGAGPTGLALACALRLNDIDVRIIDAAPGPRTTSRAIALQPRGAATLRRLGALGNLEQSSVGIRRAVYHAGGKLLAQANLTELFAEAPMLLNSQAEIEGALRHRLESLGGQIEWGTPVRPEDADADWLVGCDGAHSQVRKLAGIQFEGSAIGEQFILADLHIDLAVDRNTASFWLDPDGAFALFPLPGERLWRLFTEIDSTEQEPGETEIVERLTSRLRDRSGLTVEVEQVEWTSTFRIQSRIARTYRSGRTFLAGDAAHIHSPVGGQGMNTGIGDAENLGWKLALVVSGRADERLLDTYEAERRPVARDVIRATGLVTRVALSRNVVIGTLRDNALFPVARTIARQPVLQHRIARAVSQLDISYRQQRFARGLVPGDPVPGVETHGKWVVGERWAETVGTRLGAITTVPDSDLLIRPDGHLAARGTEIARYLEAQTPSRSVPSSAT